jgi:hypothetical protein
MALDTSALPAPPPMPSIEHVDFRADPYSWYRRLLEEAPISENVGSGPRDGRPVR